MWKILRAFFVFLGVIFFFILIALGYLFLADPYNLKPIFMPTSSSDVVSTTSSENITTTSTTSDNQNAKASLLSPAQESALNNIGVNPNSLPTSITPSQETCFVGILGQARVDEIKAGAIPSAPEFFKAMVCLK
jgi:hypothetical protein